jgi:hypothetical protein
MVMHSHILSFNRRGGHSVLRGSGSLRRERGAQHILSVSFFLFFCFDYPFAISRDAARCSIAPLSPGNIWRENTLGHMLERAHHKRACLFAFSNRQSLISLRGGETQVGLFFVVQHGYDAVEALSISASLPPCAK